MIAKRTVDRKQDDKSQVQKEVQNTSTSVIIDIDTPIAKMKEYITGKNWTGITYYKQVKGEEDVNTPFDVNSNNLAQQYDRINNYVLKLSSLSKEGEGEATVLHFRPQLHDVFTAPLLNGDMGLYSVNNVKVMNYNNSDAFDISFLLIARERNDPRSFKNIEEKVINNLHFDRDSVFMNSSPLLLEQEWDYALWLKDKLKDLEREYINNFYDIVSGMLIIGNTINLETIELFLSMANVRDKRVLDIVVPGCVGGEPSTLLKAIVYRDIDILKTGKACCYNKHLDPIFSTLIYERLRQRDNTLFSDAFIAGTPYTDLEKLIYNFIENASTDKELLKTVADTMCKDEIGYMVTPILMLIINEELRLNASNLRRR